MGLNSEAIASLAGSTSTSGLLPTVIHNLMHRLWTNL